MSAVAIRESEKVNGTLFASSRMTPCMVPEHPTRAAKKTAPSMGIAFFIGIDSFTASNLES
jgi:hypothetical protein